MAGWKVFALIAKLGWKYAKTMFYGFIVKSNKPFITPGQKVKV
jgi:hypothetical protein